MTNELLTVNARKYNGSLHRSWECELISFDGDMIECRGTFWETVDHGELGLIQAGTNSYERFWLSRGYNVFRFEEPGGELRNHYFNISLPPTFCGRTVEFIDLDIDIVIWPDGRAISLDLEEFEQNRLRFDYSDEVVTKALRTLDEIVSEPMRFLV